MKNIILYRVAAQEQIDSIFTYGYNRAYTKSRGGNMYGPGVYCTLTFHDTFNNLTKEYGDTIIKMRLLNGLENFLIFEPTIAKRVYGDKWQLEEQVKQMTGWDDKTISAKLNVIWAERQNTKRPAQAAHHLWLAYGMKLIDEWNIRGLVYYGNRDGLCALVYDFSALVPFEYAISWRDKVTGKIRLGKFQQRKTDNIEQYLNDHPDVRFRFGNRSFSVIGQAVNGFAVVQNNSKYNILNCNTEQLLSKVWFDAIDGQIDADTGEFAFLYKSIKFIGNVNSPQQGEPEGYIIDPSDGSPYCPFEYLQGIVDDMKNYNTTDFEQYIQLSDETNEAKIHKLSNLVENIVREILFEDRTVSNDGIVTIDNFDDVKRHLLHPNNNDDVWFVQIIKRHKDNPTQHFRRNACEYIAYYFIHDAAELDAKRDEIISVCKATNSRAYIQPNRRSLVNVTDYASNVLKPRFARHRNYDFMGHEIEVAAGQPKDWPDRQLCFLDIDSDSEQVHQKVLQILDSHDITPIWEYRSMNNGWHILLPEKDKVRNIDFSVIDNGMKFGRFATVGCEIDRPILLYASLKPNGYTVQQKVQNQRRRHG